MNIFCPDLCVTCPPVPGGEGIFPNPNAEANPFSNFTSEEPDVVIFNPDPPTSPDNPPLGSFNKQGCISLCVSKVSQEAADICALNQAVLCLDANCLTCPPADFCQQNPTAPACVSDEFCVQHPDAIGCQKPTQTYWNEAQQCTVTCPDGTPFTFIVPANTFLQTTLAGANQLAYSYACNKANTQKMCLSNLNQPVCCTGQTYIGIIVLTAGFPTTQPFSFAVSSGALPPGLGLSSSSSGGVVRATIGGITNTVGVYTFGITASHPSGVSSTRQYTITVIGIATSGLASGTVGTPYSETLTADGPVGPIIWAVAAGSLPDGLALDALTGVISGTPTTDQASSFSIRMNTLGVSCFKNFSIEIEGIEACPDWDLLLWGQSVQNTTGAGSVAWIPDNTDNSFWNGGCTSPDGGAVDTAQVDNTANLSYNGSGCDCNLEINWTNTGADQSINAATVQINVIAPFASLVFEGFTNIPTGVYNFPFSIPDTMGALVTIEVVVQIQVPSGGVGAGFQQCVFQGFLTNVP